MTRYLTADRLQRLADEAGCYHSLGLLLGVGGLRRGEAAALRPCDVDFPRRRVQLHRNAVRVGGQTIVGTLKSNNKAPRTVALPAFVVDALAETAKGRGRDELCGRPVLAATSARRPGRARGWPVLCAAASGPDPSFPRVTAHSRRHPAASVAISAGANPKVVLG